MKPEDIDAILDEANRLLEAGQPAESLTCLDQVDGAYLDAEDQVEWGSLRAWALTELGRHREAIELLENLLEQHPRSSRLLGTLGVVLSNRNELEDAREVLEEAAAADPEDEVALANLALVYEKLREYRRAAGLYDQALNLGADIDWVLQRKAAVLTESGQYDEAKRTLRRYLSLVPEDGAQWVALGILFSDDEEYESAFNCYERAEQLDADSPALRLNWGVTAVRAGELRSAYVQLGHLQRLEPQSTRWRLLRAFILEEEGDLEGARSVYDRLLNRGRFVEYAELTYALEMAMDFFARHEQQLRCARLMRRAYLANACTVELCEAYREATGEYVDKAFWFSMVIEADYRQGLAEIREDDETPAQGYTRFVRDYQVVARNHDEAVAIVLKYARRMGEKHPAVREFIGQEPIEDTHTGIYEVELESYVFATENPE